MSHGPHRLLGMPGGSPHCSRRQFLAHLGGLAGVVAGLSAVNPPLARAAPLVRVTPPHIMRHRGCMASVSSTVTFAGIPPGTRIAVGGDLLETDEPDDDADPCVTFPVRILLVPEMQPVSLSLSCNAAASALGLVRGVGPAEDETYSPDLVELVARVWLRNAGTGEDLGAWLSPTRVAVSSAALAWTPDDQGLSSTLLDLPRSRDGTLASLPPQACLP